MVSTWLEEVRRNMLDITEWNESLEMETHNQALGERIDLDDALAQLPPPVRLCIVLAYNDGLSHQEISDATSIPLGTVKSHISRGTAKMRELLADYGKSD